MSQTRRCHNWNYKGRGLYLLTMVTKGRKPLLGELVDKEGRAFVQYSSLGYKVANQVEKMTTLYPQLRICAKQIMPDHLHIVLWVQEPIPVPLGEIVRGFKIACTKDYREEIAQRCATQNCQSKESLWEPGFNDRVCFHKGQLDRMIAYVQDNPRRLALKRANPELFKLRANREKAGMNFTMLGNLFLLDYPEKVAVQCSRAMTEAEIEEKKQEVTDAPVPTAIEQKLEVELPFIDGVDWENAMLKLKSEALLRDSINGFSVMAKSDLDKLNDMLDAVICKEFKVAVIQPACVFRPMLHIALTGVHQDDFLIARHC